MKEKNNYSDEDIRCLAKRIYDLDTEVYDCVGSSLGRTLIGDKDKCVDELYKYLKFEPYGYKLRSEIALIGNMARTVRSKETRKKLMKEYNEIIHLVTDVIFSNSGRHDIKNDELASLNTSNMKRKFLENDHLIICISRTEGSAGTDIGFALADELRINYYDAEVLKDVLRRIEDEKDQKWQSNKLSLHTIRKSNFNRYHGLSTKDAMFFNESELLCELAKEEDFIVVGRCADVILTNNNIPHISVFITAPFDLRARRIRDLKGISYKKAVKQLLKLDKNRLKFYHYFTDKQWGAVSNYDLCINSACYGIDESVELIKRVINRETKHKQKNKELNSNVENVSEDAK